MQEFLPVVKATLLEWAQLALGNPLFAATLIIAAVLLTATVGMIRSIPVKRRAAASERARVELAGQLSATQQQAAALQERLVQRNQQISGTVQALVAGFDVGEPPVVPASEDLAAEDVWQQHDRVVTQLANRLCSEQQAKAELQQSYQAEREKRLEHEAAVDSLQNRLAEKALRIDGLERQAAEILEKHAVQSVRLAELEQQSREWDEAKNQREQLAERLAAAEAELSRLQMQADVRKEAEPVTPHVRPEPVTEAEPIQPEIHPEPVQAAAPVEPVMPQPSVGETEFTQAPLPAAAGPAAIPSPPAVEEARGAQDQPQTIVLADWDYQPEVAAQPNEEGQTAASGKDGESGFAGRFKGMFGKPKRTAAAEDVKAPEVSQAAVQSEVAGESGPMTASAPGQLGKIKSLLGLSGPKAAEAEAESAESRTAEHATPGSADAAESSESSAKSRIKKIRNLFGVARG